MLSREVSVVPTSLFLLGFLCVLHHAVANGSEGGDELVTIKMSVYSDAACAKPIQLDGEEPLVYEFEVDSAKKYEHCRREDGNSSNSKWYEFWCHENGEQISGKILCASENCEKCEVDTNMKNEDGSSMFPYGEMHLGKCTNLPEDNSTFVKFTGQCPKPGHSPVLVIVLSVSLSLLALACLGLCVFLWKRRQASQSRWYTSDSSSSSSSYRPPMFSSA